MNRVETSLVWLRFSTNLWCGVVPFHHVDSEFEERGCSRAFEQRSDAGRPSLV